MKKTRTSKKPAVQRKMHFVIFGRAALLMAAAIGALLFFSGCSSSDSPPQGNSSIEKKTLYFDFLHLSPETNEFHLAVGDRLFPLTPTTPSILQKGKASNVFLRAVPDQNITHYVADVELPSDNVQMCYVRHVPAGEKPGAPWKLSQMFIHIPSAAVERAFIKRGENGLLSAKSSHYGGAFQASSPAEQVSMSVMIGPPDTAAAIVFAHPEITSLDPDSAAHVKDNIIDMQPQTTTFSQAIQAQGDDWATSRTMIDPSTGKPYTDSKGNPVQMPLYSDMTLQFGGPAVIGSLALVKQDATLVANVSDVTDPSQMQGKLCTLQNGVTYTNGVAAISKALKGEEKPSYTISNVCTGGGYKLTVDEVEKDAKENIVATLMVANSYVRHLGMFVRYLDANNQPIPIADIGDDFFDAYPDSFTLHGYDSQNEKFLKIIGPEYVVMGVPVHSMKEDLVIPMPPQATQFQVIGNTLGRGDDHYNDLGVGITLTAAFDLAVPSLFLVMGAGTGYAAFAEAEGAEMFLEALEIFGGLLSTIVSACAYSDYKAFEDLGIELGQKLLLAITAKLAPLFIGELTAALGIGEAVDAVPFFGAAMNAIACAAIAAQIGETASQSMNSPWNYVHTLSFSHDLDLTIHHDPMDPEGFPSTATHYTVTATAQQVDSNGNVVDSSTPIQITQAMPGTTQTAPIEVTMPGVPYGGSVALAVGFYSNTQWLAGYGELKNGDNTKQDFDITITQNEVPLDKTTTYSHKEKITLDAGGNHVWTGTTTPPPAQWLGQCGQSPGQLCQIVDITDSNTFASLGYSWQACSSGATPCSSGTSGQMYHFGGISTTDTPQSSAFVSCGLKSPVRLVYDLMGSEKTQRNFYLDEENGNVIRQIRLSLQGEPDIDLPSSNKAWGKLNFSSDALLLHPNGTIVSINANLSKIEVLTLPKQAKTDAEASMAAIYAGKGIREGLLDGPLCAALTPKGEILILETANNRIQAFDTGGNPVKIFNGGTSYFAPLQYSAAQYKYMDMATEYTGYIYLLSHQSVGPKEVFYLDIYTPDGIFLSRTENFSAMKIAVSYWRDVFAANLEVLKLPDGSLPAITEPSVSRWIPSTP